MSFFARFAKSAVYALFLTILLDACTSTAPDPKPPAKETEAAKKQRLALKELAAETDIGRNMAGRLLNFYGVKEDPDLVTYINEVGSYIGTMSDHPERHYMFAILDSEAVNAFACPGGYIMVTLGSIRLAENEAELAAILGHEVAHVGEKHMFNTLTRMKEGNDSTDVTKKKIKYPDSMKMREREPLDDEKSATGDVLARYLSGSTTAGVGLLKAAKEGMYVILEKGLDKNLEFEADQLGVRYAIRAGYKPDALYNFLDRLDQQKKKTRVDTSVLDKTHPKLADRKKRIGELLAKMDAKQIIGATVDDRFQKFREGLPAVSKKQKIK